MQKTIFFNSGDHFEAINIVKVNVIFDYWMNEKGEEIDEVKFFD